MTFLTNALVSVKSLQTLVFGGMEEFSQIVLPQVGRVVYCFEESTVTGKVPMPSLIL
jgi:hypothetical protein